MANLVDIVKDIISLINLNIPVTSTNGVRVNLCYTLHITLGKIVTDENGLEYKVTNIENNSWIDVEPYGHTDIFAGTTVIAPTITFLHGSPSSVNSEYLKLDSRTLNKTPFIWLLESYEYDDLGKGSSLEASFNARMFFMDWCDAAEWINDEHNDLSIKPMTNLANAFLNVIDKSYSFKTVESSSVKVRSRFGVEVTNKGSERKIIDDDFSGVEVNVKLDLYDTEICCSSSDVPNYICYPVTYDITNSNGASLYAGSIVSGGTLSQSITNSTITLKNSLGTTQSTTEVLSQQDLELTANDATVENSDLSYSNTVASGGTLVLPDVTNTDSDGSSVVTPAQTPFVCTPAAGGAKSTMLMGSGLQTSYRTGDDKSVNAGRENGSFFTLIDANPFGNNDRFTDTLGTQVYANDIILDWAHRDYENELVLSYYRVERVATDWNDAIDSALALSVTGFTSGWYLPNIEELNNLIQMSTDPTVNLYPLTFAPFNLSANTNFWTSTTRPVSTSQALKFFNNSSYAFAAVTKTTAGYKHIYTRHTTLAELGL